MGIWEAGQPLNHFSRLPDTQPVGNPLLLCKIKSWFSGKMLSILTTWYCKKGMAKSAKGYDKDEETIYCYVIIF